MHPSSPQSLRPEGKGGDGVGREAPHTLFQILINLQNLSGSYEITGLSKLLSARLIEGAGSVTTGKERRGGQEELGN